ncbi:MAG: hypothetical protein H6549_13540 [Chitinophagales bacterium]|nr:hypothetical protein [Chitinophagales bacterium]
MEYLLFVTYLVLFAWLITKVKFFTRTGLTRSQLIILFLLKIIAGIFYGWIGMYYGGLAKMVDTWNYHTQAITEYHLLFSDPAEYLTNLFRDPYGDGVRKFFSTTNSYWNDLKGNVFIKFLSILDIFSFGNYYVNVIFYSFISLFGPVSLFRVMNDVFPNRKIPVLTASFLIPSFLYWTSGLHKEGLIFTGIALIIYVIYFSSKEKKITITRGITLLLGLLLILTLRNFIIVILLPAIATWLIAIRWPKYSLRIFAAAYLLFTVAFFTARYVSPVFDFPQVVVNKQKEFFKLVGNSTVPMKELDPTFSSFVKNTPQSIEFSALRPHPSDVNHILTLAAAVEVGFFILLLLLLFFFRIKESFNRNVIHFCIFFGFSMLLSIGFTINNLGAIVRYRSIILSLLLVPVVALIDWNKIKQLLLKYVKNK